MFFHVLKTPSGLPCVSRRLRSLAKTATPGSSTLTGACADKMADILYWNGSQTEFFHLYSSAINAVRLALSYARVGGRELAGGPGDGWLYAFLNYISTNNPPLDFISFHAKGDPRYIEDSHPHIRMNVSAQLQNIDQAFGNISVFPSYAHLPS